jgi:hypothetical protein
MRFRDKKAFRVTLMPALLTKMLSMSAAMSFACAKQKALIAPIERPSGLIYKAILETDVGKSFLPRTFRGAVFRRALAVH